MKILVAALLVLGCALPEQEFPTLDLTRFSPGPRAERATELAVGRLVDATGAAFSVGPGGVPVEFFEQVYGEDGRAICGRTRIQAYASGELYSVSVEVTWPVNDAGCWRDVSRTVQHELIHAVRASMSLSADAGHTDTGLFRAECKGSDTRHPDWLMNAASIERLCEAAECFAFNVEQ